MNRCSGALLHLQRNILVISLHWSVYKSKVTVSTWCVCVMTQTPPDCFTQQKNKIVSVRLVRGADPVARITCHLVWLWRNSGLKLKPRNLILAHFVTLKKRRPHFSVRRRKTTPGEACFYSRLTPLQELPRNILPHGAVSGSDIWGRGKKNRWSGGVGGRGTEGSTDTEELQVEISASISLLTGRGCRNKLST